VVLPPTDQLVDVLDLGLELLKVMAVGEKPGMLRTTIRLADAAEHDGGRQTLDHALEVHLFFETESRHAAVGINSFPITDNTASRATTHTQAFCLLRMATGSVVAGDRRSPH
jgi:hypothetical protein